MKKIILIFLLMMSILSSYSQMIKGSILLDNKPEPCNVLILTEVDSVLVQGAFFLEGAFNVENKTLKNIILKISGISFKDTLIDVPYTKGLIDLGVINVNKGLLSEIIITAKSPTLKIKGKKLIVNVEKTTLSEAGTVIDLLKRTPGTVVDGANSVKVLGKGTPVLYIDGRKIIANEELELVKSSDVAEIIIDRSPSALYDGDSRSVINIKTKKNLNEKIGGQVSNSIDFKREISNRTMLSANIKKGIFTTQLAYSGLISNEKLFESAYQNNYQPDYILKNNSNYTTWTKGNSNAFYLKSNINVTKVAQIGVQYVGKFLEVEDEIKKTQIIEKQTNVTKRYINQTSKSTPTLHSVSLNYKYNVNKNSSLLLIADYATRESDEKDTIDELNVNSKDETKTFFSSVSNYQIYTAIVNYNFTIPYDFKTVIGSSYSNVNNEFSTSSTNLLFDDNYSVLDDKIFGLFFTSEKSMGKLDLNFGMRYELAETDVRSTIDTTWSYTDFLGSAEALYALNDNLELLFGYSRKISRPSFRELDPTIHYIDSLSYSSGNPLVKPTYLNDFYFEAVFKGNFSASFTYTKYRDQRVQTAISDAVNPDITKMVPINVKKSEIYAFDFGFTLTKKNWSINSLIGFEIPNVVIPYLDGIIKNNDPSWSLSLSGEYNLLKNVAAFTSFSYNSAAYYDLTYQYSYNNLRMGITGKFLQKRLITSVEGFDLLNGSNWNNWDEKYVNIKSGVRGDFDSRGIRVRIAYKFVGNENKVNVKSGNQDILKRVN